MTDQTWICEQCEGHIFIADLHEDGILRTPIWAHIENTDCDDPVPIDFDPKRDL